MGKKFVKAVGAGNLNEVESIMICSKDSQVCTIVSLQMFQKFPKKFLWKDNDEIVKAIKEEAFEGPFQFIVLVFE
jgi:hypothetical protein